MEANTTLRETTGDLMEAIYGLAVRCQVVRAADAAAEVGGDPELLESALQSLIELGLLHASLDEDGVYHPIMPQAAQARMLAPIIADVVHCQRQYEEVRARLARFVAIHDDAIGQVDHSEEAQILMGLHLINEEIARAVRQARHEVVTAQPGGGRSSGALEAAWRDTEPILQRGVRMRTLYQHSARFSAATRQYVERAAAAGVQIRTVVGHFQRIIIVDRRVAFIPAQGDRRVAASVRAPAVVQYLVANYELMWESGMPFETGRVNVAERDDTVSEIRMEIIRLLAVGYTDEVVANRIGLSVRSCRAHIAKIYEQHDARSRFHLGMLIAQTGLLNAQP